MTRYMLFLSFAFAVVYSTDIKTEEGVIVLTNSNFDSVIESNENVLVEFYAPWCGHCKALAPHYAAAAQKLADTPNVKLGKVDATIESNLAEKFEIKGYPTLKMFKKGQMVDYTGGRQTDEIVNWVLKKTGADAKTLTTIDEVKSFIDAAPVVVIGFFKDAESSLAKNYLQVAGAVDDYPFGIVSDESVLKEYNVETGKIVLFKKFDDGEATYTGEEDPNELKKFILTESLPLIVEFNHDTAQKIFGGYVKTHLLLFLSKKEGHFEKYLDPIKPSAKEYNDKITFVVINVDEPDHTRILEFFGLTESEVPTMRIIKLEQEMNKYKPDQSDLSPEYIKQFIVDFFDGKVPEHMLSQTLPEDWDKHPVKVLVATNFDEVVFDKEKDVLVEFYAPWCGHCKQLVPIYDKLGEAFKDKEDVVIAKIDATVNELEHTKIQNFPTIKLYKKGENQVVQYNGDRTLEGMTKFIETGGEYGQAPHPEETGDEEDDDLPRKDEL